ncbi:helix-turn-helix domain-containing protein [Streptomyces sp. NPDC056480]|uniref:helix-turn-helix domain-containing protein n=1 Tax=Streptomyces sp. NPDC056480 TaxID=3345833 RepID=UPI0036C60358
MNLREADGGGGWVYPLCVRYADGGGLTPAGRRRRETVRMQAADLFEKQIKPSEVALRLRVSVKSAYRWHQLWRDGGVQALVSRGPSGSRCRLSQRSLEKLAVYLEQGPAAHGWVGDQV